MFEGVAVFLFGFLVGARVATVYWSEAAQSRRKEVRSESNDQNRAR